jgi:hypothetical protein
MIPELQMDELRMRDVGVGGLNRSSHVWTSRLS